MKQKYLIWAEWCWNRFIAMQLWLGSLAPGQGWSLFTWAFLKMQVQQGWSLGKQHCPAAADVWKHSLSPGPDPAAETGAWSCPGELKALAESLVHCPSSPGGGCSKGESVSLGKCSRIRVMLCLRKANREQMLCLMVSSPANRVCWWMQDYFRTWVQMSRGQQPACAPGSLLALGPCRAGSPVRHRLCAKLRLIFSSLVASHALQCVGWLTLVPARGTSSQKSVHEVW